MSKSENFCYICHKRIGSNPNVVVLNTKEMHLCDDCYAAIRDFVDDFMFDTELDSYESYCDRYDY